MDALFKDIFGIFKFLEDLVLGVRKVLTPSKAFSWQTLIYLSVFSAILSSFAVDYVKNLIAFCGWLFLIAGTVWYTTDDPLRVPGTFMPVGAVITGFLVSIFAFGHEVNVVTPRTIVLWPTISGLITAIPEFFEGSGTDSKTKIPKLEDRQKIIVLVASCMLLSCWIQFHFVIDNWLKQYPSLLTDNFKNSTFVVRIEDRSKPPKIGETILKKIEPLVEEQLIERPWSEVERWLLDANQRVGKLGQKVVEKNKINPTEKGLWRIEPRVSNIKSGGYQLDILTIWTGSSFDLQGYYLKKTCLITPKKSDKKPTVADINCSPTKPIRSAPPPQQ